ncbi:phosphopantothenoylcysteine decarboxylase subunit SIS2 isoform X2 [Trichogramma pretiosum]|uniref:phosphopantothenoylcysteine decarboxylase subunit SIS2 isoform X2 n=1 Tax=Trichogramma pretiosum TaxID=7493 RepID=UPI0006C97715|nr:phosphopantothenoylcysteine decarboxylase subunit SIS2 isoform X2 [Trichogramma pretiosum]
MVKKAEMNVEINSKSENVYKNSYQVNDLSSLISNLKSLQKDVNDVLTKIVNETGSNNQVSNEMEDDEDDEDDDESDGGDSDDGNPKPKISKLEC